MENTQNTEGQVSNIKNESVAVDSPENQIPPGQNGDSHAVSHTHTIWWLGGILALTLVCAGGVFYSLSLDSEPEATYTTFTENSQTELKETEKEIGTILDQLDAEIDNLDTELGAAIGASMKSYNPSREIPESAQ